MASAEIHNLLSFLQKLKNHRHSDPQKKDIIQRLKLKINTLISTWKIENEISVVQNVIEDYQQSGKGFIRLAGDRDWRSLLTASKFVFPDPEKLRFIKAEMEEMYSDVFKSSRSDNFGSEKDVVSFVSLLHENLKDILSSKAGILVPVKTHILALQGELRFLRNFLCFISQFCIEHRFSQDLYNYAEAVAVNTAYVLHFLRVDEKMGQEMEYRVKVELLHLVDKLKLLQQPDLGEIYLRALEGISRELLDLAVIDYECILRFFDSLVDNLRERSEEVNLESAAKDQMEILHEELSSLRFYLMDLPLQDSNEKSDNFMFIIQELAVQVGCFLFSCICKKKNQFTYLAADGGLLDKIENVKSESNHLIIPRSWQLNFPKTNEVGYIDFIIKNLEERLHCKSTPIDQLKSQINLVYEGLVALRDDFGGFAKLRNDHEKFRAVFTRYRDVAYQAEYFVDSSLCGVVSFWCQKMGLFNLAEELRHIKKELKAILNDIVDHNIGNSPSLISLKANAQNFDAVLDSGIGVQKIREKYSIQMVGLEDEVEKIMDQITAGSDQLTILSIIGMPGLGKTTMANSVYSDPSVTLQFHACAWCVVSQVYDTENLLVEILHQVQPEAKEDHEKNDKCFDQKLYQSLKGKRYLVVLDDIWDIEAWNGLRLSFPNDNNRSRIIFTTRNQSIAMQANIVPHALRLLSDDESWKLLQVKVFMEENCPPDLLQVGRKIAENCKGLPLTVVLTAGLLKITERTKDSWEQFANVLMSHEVDFPREQHLGILELSYRHLPDYLRPCFLYFGALPEDAEIPVWKLVRIWIAEGFVQSKTGQKSLEHEARNYLDDLIGRSLVMIAKRSYNGEVKTCQIHDLLRDYCIDRANEESFLLNIKGCDSLSALTDSEVHEQYRLCIHCNNWKIPPVRMGHFEARVRSLWFAKPGNLHLNADSTSTVVKTRPSSRLFSPSSSSRFRYFNKLRGVDVFFKFRLLRVLDLGSLDMVAEGSFDTITQLIHLRYLSILAFTKIIPSEMENLKDLETFLLKGTRDGYVALPGTIWNMVNLRHIQVNEGATASFPAEFFENYSKLDCLTTLSTLVLHLGKDLEKTMRKLPNLKELKCIFSKSWDDSENDPNCFAVLDFLHQLEELSIYSLYLPIVFPSSLKKLTLSDLIVFWDEISAIGKLPNLEVFKLLKVGFDGDEWHMKEGEFQKLKYLKLFRLNFCIWDASSEHLPCLEQLVVRACQDLEEIPVGFGVNPFLRMIEVRSCTTSVVASARMIEEEQYGIGNDEFKLHILGYQWDTSTKTFENL